MILRKAVNRSFYTISSFFRSASVASSFDGRDAETSIQRAEATYFLISKLCKEGRLEDALIYLERQGCTDDYNAYACVLSMCSRKRALLEGKRIHVQLANNGLETDTFLATNLINMYGKCGKAEDARLVFNKMHRRNIISWTAMVAAYAQQGLCDEALHIFRDMLLQGVVPDQFIFASILDACSEPQFLSEGKLIHARILDGSFGQDPVIANALINMYGKCGSMVNSKNIFSELHEKDVVSWTSLIAACVDQGCFKEAIQFFHQMQQENVQPNKVTFISMLKMCTNPEALSEGKLFHACILDSGVKWESLANALITMYGKCGNVDVASMIFHEMRQRDLATWTSMITAYAQHGYGQEALELFRQMQTRRMRPDVITLVAILDTCANLAASEEGMFVHSCIAETEYECDVVLGSALVNMYAKCGLLPNAQAVFDKMFCRNVYSWTSLITAYAHHGQGHKALDLLQEMQLGGLKPNEITFISILSACSQKGLADMGYYYFASLTQHYGTIPQSEHYKCLMDILGRAGLLEEVEDVMQMMPFEPDDVAWMTFLGACGAHEDIKHGIHAAENLFTVDPDSSAGYLILSNIFASAGMWNEVAKVRKAMADRGVKPVDWRTIEINSDKSSWESDPYARFMVPEILSIQKHKT